MTEMFKIEGEGEDQIEVKEYEGEVLITTYDGFSRTMAFLSPSNAMNLGKWLNELAVNLMEEKQ